MNNTIIDDRFQPVADQFRQAFDQEEELGAACSVTINGERVIDISGGFEDRKKQKPWTDDTIVCVYSSGKSVLALLSAMAVDKGLLSYDTIASDLWPEFAQAGKGNLTFAQLLSHQSGVCGFRDEIDPRLWIDWDGLCTALAAASPLWAPATQNGYHPQTFGFLIGELLRRVTGKRPGALIRDWLAAPYDLAIYCGMDEATQRRAAAMTKPPSAPDLGPINEYRKAAFLEKWSQPGGVSREEWAAAEIPASNIHSTASALARMMSAFAMKGQLEGHRLFSEEVFAQAAQQRIAGEDLVLPFNLSWAAGLMRNTQGAYGPEPQTLGHSGFGGSCVLADPVNQLSFAYTPNKMSPYLMGDPRSLKLIDAVYKCL